MSLFAVVFGMVISLTAQTLIADYPLKADGNDATGLNEAMTLTNTPFENGGIYCNGIYADGETENYFEASTPPINNFNIKAFTVSVDFMVTENRTQPVIVCGAGCRWLGFYLNDDLSVDLFYNNQNRWRGDISYTMNEWHTLKINYDGAIANAFLDDNLACSVPLTLEYEVCGDSDTSIGATNFSNGEVFKGYLKNLKVFNNR